MAKRKPKPIGKLKAEAATLLQKLRRMEEADGDGMCVCVTCGKKAHWKDVDGGHWISRARSGTLLDERNIHPQDKRCNAWGMDALGILEYRRFIVDTYGEAVALELEEKAKQVVKWNRIELEDKIADYKARILIEAERLGE